MLAITPTESTRTSLFAAFAALALHVAFIAVAASLQRTRPVHTPPRIMEMFEVEAPPLLPAPPELEPEPTRAPAPATRARAVAPRAAPSAPSSAPEPAAVAAATTSETLDFGTTFVASNAPSSSSTTRGGAGSASGVSPRASSSGTGASDRSRAPALAGATEWRCPFPLEADEAGVDHAVVTLRIDVASSGAVLAASPIDHPGHGFARSARACALRKRFAPALDRAGAPTRATATVHVSFDR